MRPLVPSNMASRLKSGVKFLNPFVDKKLFRRIVQRLEGASSSLQVSETLEDSKSGAVESNADKPQEAPKLQVTSKNWFSRDGAVVQVDSIYKTLPNAETALARDTPKPRFIWKETDWPEGFPETAEEAKTDVLTYLEQRDCYNRLKVLKVKDFCVGSTIAVTRADPYIPKGKVRFVGICIAKNHWQNTLGASFTLRNVIEGEPLEITFQLYSPLIQRIEVLKHQRRHRSALWYLRDYPPALSSVSEKTKPQLYKEEPSLYVPSKEEKGRIKKWFAQVRKEKRRK